MFLAATKKFVKRHPRLYRFCLNGYYTIMLVRDIPRLKRQIKNNRALYQLCLFFIRLKLLVARVLQSLWLHIRRKLQKRPHLFIYVGFLRDMLRGKIISSTKALARQIAADYRSRKILWLNEISKRQLKKIHQEAILCCVRHRVHKWWTFFPNAHFDSIPALQVFLREYVLRRAGDYAQYIKLRNELKDAFQYNPENEHFYDRLAEHYAQVMEDIEKRRFYSVPAAESDKRLFVIGFCVWGEHYLNMAANYCLPSLITAGNLGALCGQRKVIMFIHTNEDGKQKMSQSPAMLKIQSMGVDIVYRMLDTELIQKMPQDPNYKYWHLGMVQSFDLYFAKSLGADYHLLMPDTVYSENHFKGLLNAVARGHQAILKAAFRVRMEGMCPALDAFRKEESLCISGGDLVALGIRHLHADYGALFVTNRDVATQLPHVHVLVWEGKESLHLITPHQTILYLDREILRLLPKRFLMTLDSELDKIVPEDVPAYCPKKEDEMCMVEITSGQLAPAKPTNTPINEFCRIFWGNVESMGHWKFFMEDSVDPLSREMVPEKPYMDEQKIQDAKKIVRAALLEQVPSVNPQQMAVGLEILQAIQSSPKAKDMAAMLDELAEQLVGMTNTRH